MRRTIISEFFTTVSLKHFLVSLRYLTFNFGKIIKGDYIKKIEIELLKYLKLENSKIISFYNARSALYHTLKMIYSKSKNEIIINGYNCISVSNSVIQAGFKPIYCDINKKNLGIDIKDLEKKINKRTKAILVQHTFGKTSDIKKILEIANKNKLIVIEDCTHSLGSIFDGKHLGIFGDFSIFSTGRDKVISGVNGGFLIINNKKYFSLKKDIKNKLTFADKKEIIKNNFYNIFGYLSFKTYDFLSLGKVIISLARKLKLINEILYKEEKKCQNKNLNWKMPNSLAHLALNDFKNIDKYQKNIRLISKYYNKNIKNNNIKIVLDEVKNEKINYFRYPIILKSEKSKNDFYNYMKKNKVLLGNSWSGTNIAPKGSNLENAMYLWDCKVAENISKKILFLPNNKNITISDAKKIVTLINNFEI